MATHPPEHPLRSLLLAAAGNATVRRIVTNAPVSRSVVRRFVAGEHTADALRAISALFVDGLSSTVDFLGEDTVDVTTADAVVAAYLELLRLLPRAVRTAGTESTVDGGPTAEVSVKLTALGLTIDPELAARNAATICRAAHEAGTTVTLDAEDHTTTDATLSVLAQLRRRWPDTGAVIQAYLRRSTDDCAALAGQGARVRLCKGAYAEPATVAFTGSADVRAGYLRCAEILLSGEAFPMFATHDPALLAVLARRIARHGRRPGSYEYQLLYGVRPAEQRRLAAAGESVRVYVPYGTQWYGYLMRRMAERPANTAFFLRALASRR